MINYPIITKTIYLDNAFLSLSLSYKFEILRGKGKIKIWKAGPLLSRRRHEPLIYFHQSIIFPRRFFSGSFFSDKKKRYPYTLYPLSSAEVEKFARRNWTKNREHVHAYIYMWGLRRQAILIITC